MNDLIKKFLGEKRWVNYKMEVVEDRTTKIPYSPITKNKASSIKESDWGNYIQAITCNKDAIGIVFTPDKKLLGIDLDKCLDGNDIIGEDKQQIIEFLIEANTYCEVSPSGTGLHLYLTINEPLKLEANRHGSFECYTEGRYFTVTEKIYKEYDTIREVTKQEALDLLSILGYPWGKEVKPVTQTVVTNSIPNEEVLERMFNAKNGPKAKALYNGDTSDYKNDESSADMALCSHLAFWTNKNYSQIEAIWLASPLGSREKTQERKDYRNRTINNAINNCTEGYNPETGKEHFDEIDYDFLYQVKNKQKTNTLCVENIAKVLRLHPLFKNNFRFDEFKQEIEIREDGVWIQFHDSYILTTQIKISTIFKDFQRVGKDMMFDAICVVSFENKFDSALDYLKSLKWDGKSRLESWLSDTYGVPDDIYHRSVASNWFKGLVKRICVPGCKFDYVLVLEGPQGSKKSSSLGVIGKDWHVETTMSTENKDFFMQFSAKAIVEFSEGETLSRTEVKRMKAIITTQVDKYRAPYERVSKDHPRRCVFAMTTNSSEYLKDETGNRRWWPVETIFPKANVEWLEENRDQLFAEAYERVIINKEKTWEMPEDETRAMQDARKIGDPNTELVIDWYYNILKEGERMQGITISQVHISAFSNTFSKSMKKFEEMAIANILRDDLRLDKKRTMVNNIRTIRWYPKGMVESQYVEPEQTLEAKFSQL